MLVRVLTHFGYAAIAGLLVAGGLGVPVPEELVQLTVGYLAQRGVLEFSPALVSVYLGIVFGDVFLFLLGQSQGDRLLRRPAVVRFLTPSRRAALERHFSRHAFLTIVVARHLSGLRVPAFVLAATHGVPIRTFVAADALSALLSVPLVVSLGYLFASKLELVRRRVHEVELALLAAVLLGAAGYALVVRARERRARLERES